MTVLMMRVIIKVITIIMVIKIIAIATLFITTTITYTDTHPSRSFALFQAGELFKRCSSAPLSSFDLFSSLLRIFLEKYHCPRVVSAQQKISRNSVHLSPLHVNMWLGKDGGKKAKRK